MDIVGVLVALLCFAGIAWLFMWAMNEINPPKPVRVIIVVVLAILGIFVLANIAGWDHHLALK